LGLGAEAVGEGFCAPGAGQEVAEGVVFEVGGGGAVEGWRTGCPPSGGL